MANRRSDLLMIVSVNIPHELRGSAFGSNLTQVQQLLGFSFLGLAFPCLDIEESSAGDLKLKTRFTGPFWWMTVRVELPTRNDDRAENDEAEEEAVVRTRISEVSIWLSARNRQ